MAVHLLCGTEKLADIFRFISRDLRFGSERMHAGITDGSRWPQESGAMISLTVFLWRKFARCRCHAMWEFEPQLDLQSTREIDLGVRAPSEHIPDPPVIPRYIVYYQTSILSKYIFGRLENNFATRVPLLSACSLLQKGRGGNGSGKIPHSGESAKNILVNMRIRHYIPWFDIKDYD